MFPDTGALTTVVLSFASITRRGCWSFPTSLSLQAHSREGWHSFNSSQGKMCGRSMWCACVCELTDYAGVYQMVSIVLWVVAESLEGGGRSVTEGKGKCSDRNRASGGRKGDSLPSVVPVCWGVEHPQYAPALGGQGNTCCVGAGWGAETNPATQPHAKDESTVFL